MAFDHSAGAFVLQSRLLVGEKTLRNIRESIRTRRSHSENTGPFHILVWRRRVEPREPLLAVLMPVRSSYGRDR